MDLHGDATAALRQDAVDRIENEFGAVSGFGGNSVAKALPKPRGDVVTL